MRYSTSPCPDCDRDLCNVCGEHADDCDHGMTPSLEQELQLALMAASHGKMPRGLDRIVEAMRREIRELACIEAAVMLTQTAALLDKRAADAAAQGGERSAAPFSHGDVAAAMRTVAAPSIPPLTPPVRR